MDYITWFDEAPEPGLLDAGGKGASLCKLIRGGFSVPGGFIIRSGMFERFMQENGLREKALEMAGGIDFDNYSELVATSQEIRDMITGTSMPPEFDAMIRESYLKLGGDGTPLIEDHPVAVRSSGTAEDLDEASFAGQQDTFLYVTGASDVSRYVKECWASLYNDRALFYRKSKSFDEATISIAVVIQRMIAAEKAGVMFTVEPITQNRGVCLIEGTWGLGEAIVSGSVTPDSYTVDKTGKLLDVFISEKEIMVVRKAGGKGVEELDVPEEKRELQVLDETEIKNLADMAVRLEEFFGKPQDVEWAIVGKELYLLQSRPITTLN